MRRPRIKLWVEALESGEYDQTDSKLRHGDSYCCLGVACDLYRKKRHRGRWDSEAFLVNGLGYIADLVPIGGSMRPENNPVLKWLGISCDNERKYTQMNDDGQTFVEIAAQIRKDYSEEFA